VLGHCPFIAPEFPILWGKKEAMTDCLRGVDEKNAQVGLPVPMVHSFFLQRFNKIGKSFKILSFSEKNY